MFTSCLHVCSDDDELLFSIRGEIYSSTQKYQLMIYDLLSVSDRPDVYVSLATWLHLFLSHFPRPHSRLCRLGRHDELRQPQLAQPLRCLYEWLSFVRRVPRVRVRAALEHVAAVNVVDASTVLRILAHVHAGLHRKTLDGDNQAVPVMHAHDLQIVAPADDADAAAAVYRDYPSELTGGTA